MPQCGEGGPGSEGVRRSGTLVWRRWVRHEFLKTVIVELRLEE